MTVGTIDEDKLIITADEAISLLPEGDRIHNYANPAGGMFIGVDYSRDEAIKHFREAHGIEIAGPYCKSMGHPIAVWSSNTRVTFFAADMAKVIAFERSKGIATE